MIIASKVGSGVFIASALLLFGISALYHRFYWGPAGEAVLRCYGVVGMANKNLIDGIADLLAPDRWGRGVDVRVREVMQDGSARSGSRRVGRLSRALVTLQVTTVTVLMFFAVLAGVMAFVLHQVCLVCLTLMWLEAVLGLGGERMLAALGFDIGTYHLNEGHAALLPLALLLRHRRDTHIARPWGFDDIMADHREYVETAIGAVRERGPLAPADLPEVARRLPPPCRGTCPSS